MRKFAAVFALLWSAIVFGQGCPSILAYGGDNTGTLINNAAFLAAASAGQGANGYACVDEPPGVYLFTGNLAYTFPNANGSIMIHGYGQDVTKMIWTDGGGLTLNYLGPNNSAHVRDLTIAPQMAGVGVGVLLNMMATTVTNPGNSAPTDFTGVSWRGADGYSVTDYWATALKNNGVSNVSYTNIAQFGPTGSGYVNVGVGTEITGTASAMPVIQNFSGVIQNYVGTGTLISGSMQGFTMNQTNIVGGMYGVHVLPNVPNLAQIGIVNSQMNVSSADVMVESLAPDMQLIGNVFYVPNGQDGVYTKQSGAYSFIGNAFNGTVTNPSGNNGIVIGGVLYGQPGVVAGNTFYGIQGAPIILQSTSTKVNVQSNGYTAGSAYTVLNMGTGNTVGGGSQ